MGTQGHSSTNSLPVLRDLDQPFPFDIRMYNRPYRFEFYDTASPQHYTLLRPAVVVMCYSISNPESLSNVRTFWKPLVEKHFNDDDTLPVILLGLKRDVRSQEDYGGSVRPAVNGTDPDDQQPLHGRTFVYPEEALKVAQGMRCDRYCECSAITGEVGILYHQWASNHANIIFTQLCRAVIEDIAKTAAMTTTSRGGRADEPACSVM